MTESQQRDRAAYLETIQQENAYRAAERKGWVVPGSRKADNHTILIPRAEAVKLTTDLRNHIYQEILERERAEILTAMIQADPDSDRVCEKCCRRYPGARMTCPHCEAMEEAIQTARRIVGE